MTRPWLIVVALVLIPIAVYWPTVSHEYGFRDDYAHLREVREVPGWLTELTSSNGRPVYGYVLEASLKSVQTVADLSLLRLVSTLLFSIVGLLLWTHLRRSGWSNLEAAVIGAAVTLLPGVQVVAGWAIAWPIALGLVAAVAGFALVDRGLSQKGWQRVGVVFAGGLLYFIAGLTYQTCALFAVMPLAAVLLMRKTTEIRDDAWWVTVHIGVLFVSLFSGWLLMNAMFTTGAVLEAERMHFESAPLSKLLWFAHNPLPNSLALFALRDDFATPVSFYLVLAAVLLVIVLGFFYGAKDTSQRRRWLFAALALPFVAHSVSLAASSQAIGYRTLLPLSGLFLVLAMFGLRALMARFNLRQAVKTTIFSGVLVIAAWQAQHNTFSLIAEPQGREWQLVKSAAERLRFDADTQVFVVLPKIGDRSTERIYADEFGSLTSDAEWAAEEMFKTAIRERFPAGLPQGARYVLDTGSLPPGLSVDLILDMRRLKLQSTQALPTTAALRR
ncbi:MAG: glucosyltransferase domain-containing protein [Pseudomonadota bacterium]